MPYTIAHPAQGMQVQPPNYTALVAFATVSAFLAAFNVNLTTAQLRDPNAPKAALDTQFFPAAFSAVSTNSPAAYMVSFLKAVPRAVAGNEAFDGNESPGNDRDFLSALHQAGFTMVPLQIVSQPYVAGGAESFVVRMLSALIRIVAMYGLGTLAGVPRLFLNRHAQVNRPAGNQTFVTLWLHFVRTALPQFFPGHAGPVQAAGYLTPIPPAAVPLPAPVPPPALVPGLAPPPPAAAAAAAAAAAGLPAAPPPAVPAAAAAGLPAAAAALPPVAAPAAAGALAAGPLAAPAAAAAAAPGAPPLPDIAPGQAGVHAKIRRR